MVLYSIVQDYQIEIISKIEKNEKSYKIAH